MVDRFANGSKQTWRGWWTNNLIRLIKHANNRNACHRIVTQKTAVGCYLPSQNDREAEALLKKGFRRENLVAVDTDAEAVKNVRKCGGVAIQTSLQAFLGSRSVAHLDFISADLFGGFTRPTFELMHAIVASPMVRPGTAVLINLKRGRDGGVHFDRRKYEKLAPFLRKLSEERGCCDFEKHRGAIVFSVFFELWWRLYLDQGLDLRDWDIPDLFRSTGVRFYSYKSKHGSGGSCDVYDSVVFNVAATAHFNGYDNSPSGRMNGALAALKAVRTKKLRAAIQ